MPLIFIGGVPRCVTRCNMKLRILLSVFEILNTGFFVYFIQVWYDIDESHARCASRCSVSSMMHMTIDEFSTSLTYNWFFFSLFFCLWIIRCGQETRVIPRILQLRSHWLKSEKESLRLEEAGITKEVSVHNIIPLSSYQFYYRHYWFSLKFLSPFSRC